jgi:beta-glucosidase
MRVAVCVAAAALASTADALVEGPWSDVTLTPDERAAALLKNMTQDEKLVMLHGPATGPCCQCTTSPTCAYVGNIAKNDRLQIPPVTMNDGPQGFRDDNFQGSTTAFPSGLTMAASFDVDAMFEWGQGMGKEFYAKGANVQLGPGLCLARVPRNGRNFEYLSGEDPFLGCVVRARARVAVACVRVRAWLSFLHVRALPCACALSNASSKRGRVAFA